ncbi:uncharacterized protein LOC110028922 isoform X2 [Phalaenopsis equestris]|uniref:uncharacterized protein LOC110028922 isoform X2 n=1 Tax=Phalaenopsis equestris TaxID=78828 RepID=UPI0009E561E4|nr:uncharacterized protein LOC110028922 isoform X2 [Phalaenopsis equestris]
MLGILPICYIPNKCKKYSSLRSAASSRGILEAICILVLNYVTAFKFDGFSLHLLKGGFFRGCRDEIFRCTRLSKNRCQRAHVCAGIHQWSIPCALGPHRLRCSTELENIFLSPQKIFPYGKAV